MSFPADPGAPGGGRRRLIVTLARWSAIAVILYFIGRSLVLNWSELEQADLHFDLAVLLASMGLLAAWMVGQAVVWHLLTRTLDASIPWPRAIAVWFYSQLGKYVPGKVFLFLGRLHFYTREGRRAGPVTVAFTVELMANLAASIFVVLAAAFGLQSEEMREYRWLLLGGLVLLLLALHPRAIRWSLELMARLFRRRPVEVTLGYGQMLRYVGTYVVNWLVLGVALLVFIRSFYPIEASSVVFLAGAFSLAATLGILAVFAPSGLGVREGVLAVFLSQIMPTPVALVVSIASRVWLTLVELILVAVFYLLLKLEILGGDGDAPTAAPPGLRADGGLESDI